MKTCPTCGETDLSSSDWTICPYCGEYYPIPDDQSAKAGGPDSDATYSPRGAGSPAQPGTASAGQSSAPPSETDEEGNPLITCKEAGIKNRMECPIGGECSNVDCPDSETPMESESK
jgi:hypothetical protein